MPAPSLVRWRELIDPLLDRDAVRLHRRYTAILHSATELGRRARSGNRHRLKIICHQNLVFPTGQLANWTLAPTDQAP